jgi:hypothetical protein
MKRNRHPVPQKAFPKAESVQLSQSGFAQLSQRILAALSGCLWHFSPVLACNGYGLLSDGLKNVNTLPFKVKGDSPPGFLKAVPRNFRFFS